MQTLETVIVDIAMYLLLTLPGADVNGQRSAYLIGTHISCTSFGGENDSRVTVHGLGASQHCANGHFANVVLTDHLV